MRRFLVASFTLGLLAGPARAVPALYLINASYPPGPSIWELDPVSYEVRGPAFDGGELAGGPYAITQGGDGAIYVLDGFAGTAPPELHRYEGATLEHQGVVIPASSTSGLGLSDTMMIAPNGDLYISGGSPAGRALFRFDLETGVLVDTLPGIAEAFAFGPDGLLYAASAFTNVVERFDPETLESLGVFWATADASSYVRYLRFDAAGNLYAMNGGYDPNTTFSFAEVFRLDSTGMQTGASGRWEDAYGGPYDFEVNPFTGEVLSVTDESTLFRWDLNGGGRVPASGPLDSGSGQLFPIYDFLITPEPSTLLLLGLGLVLMGRGRR